MAKYGELVALLEWAEKKNKVPTKFSRKEPSIRDMIKFQKELAEFEEFQEFRKKKDKKDEKKDEKKDGMGVVQKTILLTFLSPFVGLGYVWLFAVLLKRISLM